MQFTKTKLFLNYALRNCIRNFCILRADGQNMTSDYSTWFVVKLVTNVICPVLILKRRFLVKRDNGNVSEVRHFCNKMDVVR